jgi:hypothetical protein
MYICQCWHSLYAIVGMGYAKKSFVGLGHGRILKKGAPLNPRKLFGVGGKNTLSKFAR